MQFLQSGLLARQIKCCREYLLVFSKYFMQYWQQAACKNLTESGYSLLFLVSYKKVSKEADLRGEQWERRRGRIKRPERVAAVGKRGRRSRQGEHRAPQQQRWHEVPDEGLS